MTMHRPSVQEPRKFGGVLSQVEQLATCNRELQDTLTTLFDALKPIFRNDNPQPRSDREVTIQPGDHESQPHCDLGSLIYTQVLHVQEITRQVREWGNQINL